MDLIGACQVFVSVSERGSFTLGAAAAQVPQSVASRRVAALEEHLGERLLDRSTRRATLTAFGRDILPTAQRLVRLAESLEDDASRARRRPLRLAVPASAPTRDLARLDASAREKGVFLEFEPTTPTERAELVRSREVRAALVAVAPGEAVWSVPLGVAGTNPGLADVVFIETLRRGRGRRHVRADRIWIQPEDDVPHVRDRITRVADSVGLAPAQIALAPSLATASAEVYGSGDLLLCSPGQAVELGLSWHSLGELHLVRGYDVAAETTEDAERIRVRLGDEIAILLGAAQDGRDDSEVSA